MCGVSWCCYRGWVGVVCDVWFGWCVRWVLVSCGFSNGRVGVGGVWLVVEVLLLVGGQFPVFALFEA